MKISTFKFGETPLYLIDGIVSRGVLFPRKHVSRVGALSGAVFFVSVALFGIILLRTSGVSYAARAAYFLANIRESLFGRSVLHAIPLPLEETTIGESSAVATLSTTLTIPKLGVSAPIVEIAAASSGAIDEGLVNGVIRWPGSAALGEKGTTILLGHSSAPLSYRGAYGSVFALLDKLEPGDIISVQRDGKELRHRVESRLIIDPKKYGGDFTAAVGNEELVLVSCWPTGTDWRRIAVRAERI